MASSIKNVAWVGTGRTGKPLLDIVAKSNKFKITLLVRKPASTYTTIIPPSIKVVQVDFQSHTSLVSALQGIDAVVNVLTFGPASSIDLIEIALINAAIEAGVKFFIPSEWAPDSAGANVLEEQWIGRTLRPNVVIAPKRSVHNYLMARAGQGKIAYAVVFTGVIIPSSLAVGMISFDFKTKIALLPDDGIHLFPATTLTTAGAAVVAILSNALSPTVKNRFIHISDFTTSQAEILSIVEETLGGTPWTRKNVPVKGFFNQSISNIEKGIYGVREFAGVLTSPFFGGGTTWKADDNEILGLGERQNLRLEVAALAKQYAANN